MTEIAQFLWGAPEETRARLRSDIPQFRLVNEQSGGFAPVAQTFAAENVRNAGRVLDADGHVVGTTWEDDDAEYCILAGVLPADLSAPRGEQAASVFLQLEAFLAKAGMAFADVVRTWLYIDRVCEW